MKVALVHDWLIHMRGGEKVLEAFAEIYPEATIYTLFFRKEKLSSSLQRMNIKASFLQYLPGIRLYYRFLLPILPWVIRTLKIEEAEVVLSSSHCVAKGIKIPEGARHICYCHTPMRYLWGFEKDYLGNVPFFLRPVIDFIKAYLKKFDLKSNETVHDFIANAENVRKRIQNYYGRSATVIYPPVNLTTYQSEPAVQGDAGKPYYLVVSAFVPYKRVDLVIEAFNPLDKRLIVVGSGPLEKNYRLLRKNSNISFLGGVTDAELKKLYRGAKALIFPTEEDFGIVPLEAQACGTPVIALGRGGALESVKHGIFFEEQTPESLRLAVEDLEKLTLDRIQIPQSVEHFNKDRFKTEIADFVKQTRKNE